MVRYKNSIDEILVSDIDHDTLCFQVLPANYQNAVLNAIVLMSARVVTGAFYVTMGFAGGLILSLTVLLLIYLYGKLNDTKLARVPSEVLAQTTCDFSPENIRLTAARLKESPLQISSRLPPRTGRRYIVVGGVGQES